VWKPPPVPPTCDPSPGRRTDGLSPYESGTVLEFETWKLTCGGGEPQHSGVPLRLPSVKSRARFVYEARPGHRAARSQLSAAQAVWENAGTESTEGPTTRRPNQSFWPTRMNFEVKPRSPALRQWLEAAAGPVVVEGPGSGPPPRAVKWTSPVSWAPRPSMPLTSSVFFPFSVLFPFPFGRERQSRRHAATKLNRAPSRSCLVIGPAVGPKSLAAALGICCPRLTAPVCLAENVDLWRAGAAHRRRRSHPRAVPVLGFGVGGGVWGWGGGGCLAPKKENACCSRQMVAAFGQSSRPPDFFGPNRSCPPAELLCNGRQGRLSLPSVAARSSAPRLPPC